MPTQYVNERIREDVVGFLRRYEKKTEVGALDFHFFGKCQLPSFCGGFLFELKVIN